MSRPRLKYADEFKERGPGKTESSNQLCYFHAELCVPKSVSEFHDVFFYIIQY